MFCCECVPFVTRQTQKKGIKPFVKQIKYVKGVFCVDQLCSVQPVTNVRSGTQNLPVGARLYQFEKTWVALGAISKVIRMFKEGYTHPFWN